jgi:Na+/H+ antiporter NhaD/arsenite permease-like protein
LSIITGIFSSVLDNVTTVILIIPITLAICENLEISPVPVILSEIFAANIGGTATLIGDPPNIIIGSAAHLSFMDFILNLAPFILVLLILLLFLVKLFYKKEISQNIEEACVSGISCSFINNISYTISMVPVIHNIGMVTSFNLNPVWWALSLGACLGGNATFIAAAANLVGVNILKRQHIIITFKGFLRVGFPIMLISLVLSSVYLFLRYLW